MPYGNKYIPDFTLAVKPLCMIARTHEQFLHCIIYETRAYLPASELICLRDVWVDHKSTAEGCREWPASKVWKLCPLNGNDRLARSVKLFCLWKERNTIFNLLSPSFLQTDNIRYTCFWTKRSFMVLNKYGQRFIKRFRKSLSTKDKSENQYWIPMIFRPAAPY